LGWFGVTDGRLPPLESSSECDSNVDSEVSSHSLHYQTGWLFYLPFTYLFPGCITFHRLSIYLVLVFFCLPREMMLEEYFNKKDKKKKRIWKSRSIRIYNCLPSLCVLPNVVYHFSWYSLGVAFLLMGWSIQTCHSNHLTEKEWDAEKNSLLCEIL